MYVHKYIHTYTHISTYIHTYIHTYRGATIHNFGVPLLYHNTAIYVLYDTIKCELTDFYR